MAHHALAVEDRHVEPCVVGTITGGPDDRLDLAGCNVQSEWRGVLDPGGRQSMRRLNLAIKAVITGPRINGVQQSTHLETGQRAHVAQRTRKLRFALSNAGKATNKSH